MDKRMIGYDFLDGRNRRLVYQKSLSPRTPLACLLTFRRAVGGPEAESPRSAASSAEFRTQVRPQPSFAAPLVRPLPEHPAVIDHRRIACRLLWQPTGGRASGGEGRLRSSTCSKLRHTCRRRRRLCSSSANGLPEHCQAGQRVQRRRRFLIYEPAISAVTKTVTDKKSAPPHAENCPGRAIPFCGKQLRSAGPEIKLF
jgi:hypothetical protein